MRSIRLGVVLALLSITTALYAEQSSPLLASLNNEFLGKSFQTKLKVGRYATVNQQRRLVDTEVNMDGSIGYLARGFWPAQHIAPTQLEASFAPGTPLWVWKIELKDDRIEFWLSSSATTHAPATEAKLKFILGKGYESWEYGRLEAFIANSLRIERLEKLAQLRSDYADLSRQLAAAKSADASIPAGDLDAQIASKQHLADLYVKLAANRKELAAFGQSDTESANYIKEADNIRSGLNSLLAQRRLQQQAKLVESASAIKAKYGVLKRQIPLTRNLQQRQEKIAQAKMSLDDLSASYSQQQALGFSVSAEDLAWVSSEKQSLDASLADIPNLEAKQRLNDLDAQYRTMEQKRNALQAAYMKASGTPDQAAAADTLKKHLQVMYDNRLAAERAGSRTAKQQAAGLEMVIQHLN